MVIVDLLKRWLNGELVDLLIGELVNRLIGDRLIGDRLICNR